MACHSCFQVCVLAFPRDIAEDLEGHSPVQDILAPAVDLLEAPAGTADCTGSLFRMVDLSFSPMDPWNQVAGFGKKHRVN